MLRAPATAIIAGLSMLTGCVSTFEIPLDQIPRLSANTEVRTVTGRVASLDSDFKVEIRRGGVPSQTFKSPISAMFQEGMLLIQGAEDPAPQALPLWTINGVQVRQFSAGKTTGLIVGCVLGAAVVVAVSIAALSGGLDIGLK